MVGNKIYLKSYIFNLFEADAYTEKYMKDNPEIFVDSDLLAVIDRIRSCSIKFESIEEFVVNLLKALDTEGRNYVPKTDILSGLKNFNLFLSTQEILVLTQVLGTDENGDYSMEDLYNLIIKC